MTTDKRSVTTDALDTLGFIIGDTEARDAIHLAVEPIEAGGPLRPGQHVHIQDGKGYACRINEGVGIVDPFLSSDVRPGQRFWLVVYPRQITSLRHVWTHPAFAPAPEAVAVLAEKAASEAWLRDFIGRSDCPDYDTVIAAACGEQVSDEDGYCSARKEDDYLHFSGWDAHGEIPDEFWDHLEVVTGQKFGKGERPAYFSCSC